MWGSEMKAVHEDIDPELAGELAVRVTSQLIAETLRIADAEKNGDPSMIVYGLMTAVGYWLNVVDPVMRVKLIRQVEHLWPEMLAARLEGDNAVN
jgi:hypothetical protein